MVKFIESELVSLKKEVNEMWTLVYNQLDRAGEAVLTFNRDQAQQVIVREKRVNAFELKIDSDVEKYLADAKPLDYLQFQRIGYFNVDKDSTPEHLVFNRTVSLKDTWSKINK
jgi:phosphate uptake regulator